ncbi:MAG: hypothetical protein QW267_07310, partial [Sulfolobales archaeon]
MSKELLSINESIMSRLRKLYDECVVQVNEVNSLMIKIVNNDIALKHAQTIYTISLYLVKHRRTFVLESSTSNIDELFKLVENVGSYIS